MSIPSQNITFNLTVTGPTNNPPAAPSVTGPTQCFAGTPHNWTFRGTDPDGNQVRYFVDWNGDGVIDQGNPFNTPVNSGQSVAMTYTYGSAGTYTLRALTQDINGANSGWTTITVNCINVPPITANLQVNGSDGPLNVAKNSTLTISWTSANAGTCSLFGAGLPGGSVSLSGNTSVPANAISTSPETYVLSCNSVTDTVAVTVQNGAPNPPAITQTAGNNEEGTIQTFSFTGTDPDNDQIFYEVDWDNNGTVDASTPASSYVNSGTTLNGNRSWPTPGTYTF